MAGTAKRARGASNVQALLYLFPMKLTMLPSLLCVAALASGLPLAAQTADSGPTATINVRSNLVVVPALVKTKSGAVVFTLGVKDFALTDNGIAQTLRLEEDTGAEPLALVIVVETGGDGAAKLGEYHHLAALLDNLIGAVPRRVAVVSFDSTPTLEQPFTPSLGAVDITLNSLQPGDMKAAVYDGLSYAVELLRKQPPSYRRAILLLSETLDNGSHTPLVDTLHAIADTNTAIYSVAFNSTKSQVGREAAKFSSAEPGPAHGCFSRQGANPTTQPSVASQDYNCVAELLPPLRLAKMAATIVANNFRRNAAETVAQLTGGEYYKFKDVKELQRDLFTIANHVPNRYVLSFQPSQPKTGFHTLQLTLPDHVDLRVEARNGYWIDDPNAPAEVTPDDGAALPKNAPPAPPQ
jgi:VWFA-related protein